MTRWKNVFSVELFGRIVSSNCENMEISFIATPPPQAPCRHHQLFRANQSIPFVLYDLRDLHLMLR